MTKPIHEILTESYQAQLKDLGNGLHITERIEHSKANRVIVETFGPNWILGFANLQPHQLGIRSGQKILQIVGPHTILIPPFSLIEWHLRAGDFHWQAISSDLPLPPALRNGPSIYPWDSNSIPITPSEIFLLLKNNLNTKIQEEKNNSQLAKKIKLQIIQNYKEDIKISELANGIGISRVVFSRQFSSTYGITPIHYRSQLRIYEALRLMNQGFNITDAIMQCGFSSINQFIIFFKGHFLAVPKQYKINRQTFLDITQ